MTLLDISMDLIHDVSNRACLAVDSRTDISRGERGVVGSEDDFGLTDLFGEALEPTIWPGTGAGPPEISDQPRLHGTLQFMRASFGTADDIDGEVIWAQPPMANGALENGDKMKGKVAVVKRGYNTFLDKALQVCEAGAVALIIMNWADRLEIFSAATDGEVTSSHVSIPIVCVRQCDSWQLVNGRNVRCGGPGIEQDDLLQVLVNPQSNSAFQDTTIKVDPEKANMKFQCPDTQGLFAGFMQHGDCVHVVEYGDEEQGVLQVLSSGDADYPIPNHDQIQGILDAEYSTLAEYENAIHLFQTCMVTWREKSELQDAVFGNKKGFTKMLAMHMNHLEVATRTANTLRQVEVRNEKAEGLILHESGEEAISLLTQSISDIDEVEEDLCGRDVFRISLFDIPQMTYQLLQHALLGSGRPEMALAVAVQAKARSLVDMIQTEMRDFNVTYKVGDRVRIQGLKVSTGLNGTRGAVTGVGQVGKTVWYANKSLCRLIRCKHVK